MKTLFACICILLSAVALAETPEQAVERLKLQLPAKGQPTANFVYAVTTGQLVFTAGHVSIDANGKPIKGKLGTDLSTQQGALAARAAGVSLLATLKQHLGSLDRVKRVVKVLGMVNASAEFTEHSQVMNGFSDLMVEVFGDAGKHARSAVGMASLPGNYAVEIEMIVELHPEH